jgi:hypothetical protein
MTARLEFMEAATMVSDDIQSRAQADLQRAERDIQNYQEKLAKATQERNDLSAFLRKLEHYAVPTVVTDGVARTRSARGSGGKGKVIVDFCIDLIRNAGRRMKMNEIFPAVIKSGINIGGTDEKSVLAGYLSRDKRVDFEREDGWGVVETEGAADLLAGTAAPSFIDGGQNERATLTLDPVARTDPFS